MSIGRSLRGSNPNGRESSLSRWRSLLTSASNEQQSPGEARQASDLVLQLPEAIRAQGCVRPEASDYQSAPEGWSHAASRRPYQALHWIADPRRRIALRRDDYGVLLCDHGHRALSDRREW